MDRIEFIKTCTFSCLGASAITLLLQSCSTPHMISGTISGNDLVFNASNFEAVKKEQKYFRKYLIIHHDSLQFPICVYRFNEISYTALYMRCPHQGAELQVFGNKLQCPAHGSEFDNQGTVQNSPADTNLRSFPLKLENNQILISLK